MKYCIRERSGCEKRSTRWVNLFLLRRPGGVFGGKKTIRDTIEYNMSFINKYRDVGQNLEAERQQVADEWNRKLHDLVGDTDKLKHEITENMGKMKQLEQSVAAEKQSLLQKEAELSKM